MNNFGEFVREVACAVTVLVILFMLFRVFMSYRNYSPGQKFLAGGIIGTMLYVADGLREAIEVGFDFRMRLIPLCIGLACYVFYITEPSALAKKRWGRDPLKDKDETL